MPMHTHSSTTPALAAQLRADRDVLYPARYCWHILFASIDIMLTWLIIEGLGGWEVNAIASHALSAAGLWGLVGLKVATIVVVLVLCERIGRESPRAGALVATAAVALSVLPVAAGLGQIARLLLTGQFA